MIIEQRIILALKEKPRNATEAAKVAFTIRDWARHLLKRLHAAKRVHIVGWTHSSRGPYAPVYAWGPGEDAPKPQRQSSADRCLQYRHRLKKAA